MDSFLTGAVFMAANIAALFFLNFWRQTRDSFFLWFAIAFFFLGIERLLIAVWNIPSESYGVLYLVRLAAFLMILLAIVLKNRATAEFNR